MMVSSERGRMAPIRATKATEQPWISPMAMVWAVVMGRASSRAAERLGELAGYVAQGLVEDLVDPAADRLGHAAVERLGDPARHTGQRVAVAAQRDRQPDRMLEVIGLQERPDRLRDAVLAGHLEAIPRSDLVQRRAEVVA